MKPKQTFIRLLFLQQKTDEVILALENELADKILFDFYITYSADGFCISNTDADLAPLDMCIDKIELFGLLSLKQFNNIII